MKKLYLLHGSLGAGKTTLLNKILSNNFFKKSVVIENEFASFSVDGFLISKNDNSFRTDTITGGCICCTSGQEFMNTLYKLVDLSDVDRIIIESTGVANSIEIIKQLILSEGFESKFEFGANIMLVDALEDDAKELVNNKIKEIKLSDLILVTKSDIADIKKVSKLISIISTVNPNIQKSIKGDFNSASLFIDGFESAVSKKLKSNIDEYLSDDIQDTGANNYYVMKLEGRIDDQKVKNLVDELVENSEINVKRIKGFYHNSDDESIIVNGTKNNIEYLRGESVLNENAIVIIGANINAQKIENVKSKILNTYE